MITRAVCPTLIGRESELTRLEDALLAARRGEGGLIVLAGDAGIGKTRLVTELRQRAEKIGTAVMEGGCSESELALPYLPFIQAIGHYLETTDVNLVAQTLGRASGELGQLFPQLATADSVGPRDESAQAKLRLFEAILAMLRISAGATGLLLILEDLHWADASTRDLLDYVTRRLRSNHILVFATYRKDELHRRHPLLPVVQGWQRSRLAEVIELAPLPAADIAQMVGAIFDTDVGDEFRDFIHDRCEGNPFVLEEMLKAALDAGDIFRKDEEWQRKPIEQFRLPETVRDTILLRVTRLNRKHLEVLRAASVLGSSFDYLVLAECCDQDRSAVEDALEVLTEQQLLEEESGGRSRYRFRHALTREAIYDSVSAPRRERLHGRAADAVRMMPKPSPIEVAHHLFLANRAADAIPLCLEAADAAAAAYAFREAAELRLRALPFVDPGVERSRLVGQIGVALGRAGSANLAIDYLQDAVDSSFANGQPELAAHFRIELAFAKNNQGRPDLGREELRKALIALEPRGPSRDLGRVYAFLAANATVVNYQQEEAIELCEKALSVAEATGDDESRAWAHVMLGNAIGNQGRVEEAMKWIDSGCQEALAHGRYEIAAIALNNGAEYLMRYALKPAKALDRIAQMRRLPGEFWRDVLPAVEESFLKVFMGDLAGGLELGRRGSDASRLLGNPSTERTCSEIAAVALIEMGRYDEAGPLVRAPNPADGPQHALFTAWPWLELQLATGDIGKAVKAIDALIPVLKVLRHAEGPVADQVVEAALEGDRMDLARQAVASIEAESLVAQWPLHLLPRARVARVDGDLARARDLAMEAVSRFAEAGYVPFECRARVFLAQCLIELNQRAAAEAELRSAWSSARSTGSVRMQTRAAEILLRLGIEIEAVSTPGKSPETPPVGERLVTVLFADVRGYSSLSEGTSPADLVDRLSALHRSARQEVERQRGVVDKFAGDAVMATFNVSGRETNHAEHAVASGLALVDKAAVLGLPVGVGIATGPAIVGHLTAESNLSVVGETTNLASRLQAVASAGEIVISAETHRRVRDWLARRDIKVDESDLNLKGLSGLTTAYRFSSPASGSWRS